MNKRTHFIRLKIKSITSIAIALAILCFSLIAVFGSESGQRGGRFATLLSTDGGKIILQIPLTDYAPSTFSRDSWTVVQWQTEDGQWRDVNGWQGTFHYDESTQSHFVEWWVGRDILGRGPFRWVVYADSSRSTWLTTSKTFNLPDNRQVVIINPTFSRPVTTAAVKNTTSTASTSAETNIEKTDLVSETGSSVTPLVSSGTVAGAASIAQDISAENNGPTFYVSKNGNNLDGLSWESAWSEMDQIDWSIIEPGATIYIDGGPNANRPMTYTTQLRPTQSGTTDAPILIQLSTENRHDGQVILFGGNSIPLPECGQTDWDSSQILNSGASAILFENGVSNLIIDGRKRQGIVIHGWGESGIIFDPDRLDNGEDDNTKNISLQYMEIFNNGSFEVKNDGETEGLFFPYHASPGIKLSGIGHSFSFLEIHDNAADAIQSNFTNPESGVFNNIDDFSLSNSWLYNQRSHSGVDNSPAGETCTLEDSSGCDELGAPSMSADFLTYPEIPSVRSESFNWCTHNDGIQIYSSDDLNNLTIEKSIIGPNLMNGLLLGDRDSDTTTAWVNDLTLQDVVITRFTHSALGMKNPEEQAGQNWNLDHVTIYGHFSNTNKGTLQIDSTAASVEHQISNSTMQFGRTDFANGNIKFTNNCESDLYAGSIGGVLGNPDFENIIPADVFENDLSVDFSKVFKDNYLSQNEDCTASTSRITSVEMLLSEFTSE